MIVAERIRTQTDQQHAARDELRRQIARLDGELMELSTSGATLLPARRMRGPGLLSLAELERARDDLADRVASARRSLDERGEHHETARRACEEMLLDPEDHRFGRVTRADIGECGCGGWEVRPRLGLIGMLMNWWRVVVSSGCP